MENHHYNLANISKISDLTSSTYREHTTQLELENRNYLHSTFSYPLHSTVHIPNQTIDISTLQDTMNTTLNYNLPESQLNISDSSMDSGHSTNHSSDSFTLDTKADDSMIDWECCSSDSECDSSCLSFDVDDLSFHVDDKSDDSQHCQMPSQSPGTKCYINNVIHNQIGVQMWGDDYTAYSDSTQGDCDVCNLLKMKRQRASTDLRFDGRKPGSAELFSNSSLQSQLCDESRSRVSTSSMVSMKNSDNFKLFMSGSILSSVVTKVFKPSLSSKCRKSSFGLSPKEKMFRKSLENMRVCERLHPQGMASDSVSGPAISTDEVSLPTLSSQCQRPLTKSTKHKSLHKNITQSLEQLSNKISHPSVTPAKQKSSKRKSGGFCDALPTPSPWRGDKKTLIKRLKTDSIKRLSNQFQSMGCV